MPVHCSLLSGRGRRTPAPARLCTLVALLIVPLLTAGACSGDADTSPATTNVSGSDAPPDSGAPSELLSPQEAAEAVCDAFALPAERFAPGDRVLLDLTLPENMGEVDLALWLSVDGERTGTAWVEPTPEGGLLWFVPSHPLDPMEGGTLLMEPEAGELACAPISITLDALTPAPGALRAIADRSEAFLQAHAEGLGLDWGTLQARVEADSIDALDDLPVTALPLLQALSYLRSGENAFDALLPRVDEDDEPWLEVLEALLAIAWPAEALDAEMDRLRSSPLAALTYEERDAQISELRTKGRFLMLIPTISDAQSLSDAMIESYTNCAIHQEGLSSGLSTALSEVAVVGSLIADVQKAVLRLDNALRTIEAIENAASMEDFLSNGLDLAKPGEVTRAVSRALRIIRAMQLVMWVIEEVIRARCQLLPSEIASLDAGPTLLIPEDSSRPHDALPLTVEARSQEWEIYEMLSELLPSIPPRIQPAINAFLTLNQQAAMLAQAGAFMNSTPIDLVLSELTQAAAALQEKIDMFNDFKTLNALEWTVRITEEEWIDWELVRDVAQASPCPSGSLCVEVGDEPGLDELRMGLPPMRFPEWTQRAVAQAGGRPSFSLTHRDIEIGMIRIDASPNRRLVEPGEQIDIPFAIHNAEDPSVRWDLSAGRFLNGERWVIQETFDEAVGGVWRDTLTIDLPTDESLFPITLEGRSLSTTGTMRNGYYRGTSVVLDLESAWITPSHACLRPGEEITLRVEGLYEESTVTWSAERGSITPIEDGTEATFRAPDSGDGELQVSARIEGRTASGRSRDTTAETVLQLNCRCWWSANFSGAANGVAGGYDATITDSSFYDPDLSMVTLSDDDGDTGIFIMFDPPPGGDLSLQEMEAAADIWGGPWFGGPIVEREFGFVVINRIRFSRVSGGFVRGTYEGSYYTAAELLTAPREERDPQITQVFIRFQATANDRVFCHH